MPVSPSNAPFQEQLDAIAQTLAAKADASAIPTMATAAPPGVSDSGAAGTNSNQFTGPLHTHASKARKQRILGVAAATYTWVYPTPFASGVVPICNGIAEDPADSALDSYNVQISGAPTNTQAVFRIKRQTAGLFGLITGAIGFNPAPGTINLHLSALEP